jgi:para-aminobenzoate synthetase component I
MSPAVQSLPTDQSAVEAARQFQHQQGLVFLDSSQPERGAVSIVARDPIEIIRGKLPQDAEALRAALLRHRSAAAAGGGLFGWVEFDGSYVFGVYLQSHTFEHDGPTGHSTALVPPPPFNPAAAHDLIHFKPLADREEFVTMASRAKEYIRAGDIYQVNLSYPWKAAWPPGLHPFTFYEKLRSASPAPHAAFMNLGGTQLLSASPECFLRMSGKRVVTRPIKGTRPRSADMLTDGRLASELQRSAKERAELVMITDLERNDLGQICDYGSVQVTEMLKLEQFAQVHHLVSTVEGTLRSDVDHVDALVACFPGGSISGAPKKRALEIIRELEHYPRGLYTGAVGFMGFNGESRFSIAIRTAWVRDGVVQFHTGAGIVADSSPALEYEETLHKAAGLLQAAGIKA